MIKESILGDNAYRNACRNSDRQDAALECKEAVKRAVLAVENAEFMKLYYDMEKFRIRLLNELFNETYPALSSVKESDEPKANAAQENDTEKQEPTASGTTDAEDMEQPKPDTAEPTIQENDIKEPEPAASGTTDAGNAGQDTPDMEEPTVSPEPEVIQTESNAQEMPKPCNFIITDDRLGEGGPKAKFGTNMEAITALKKVESENRPATPEEQQVLSKYVGWGGVPDAFEPDKAGWEKEYQDLKTILTPEEYDSARASVLNAHYTSPTVIKAIYGAVGSMGFTSGRILEPACGIGNFFGLLPKEMSESKLYGVELDGVSGRIAKLLYPNARIHITGYENAGFPEDFFDLAIGNVPFGQYQVNDPEYNRFGFSIHTVSYTHLTLPTICSV